MKQQSRPTAAMQACLKLGINYGGGEYPPMTISELRQEFGGITFADSSPKLTLTQRIEADLKK